MERLESQAKELRLRPPADAFIASYFKYKPGSKHAPVALDEPPEFEP